MNERILHKDVQDFITKNLKSNIPQLVLKGSPFEDVFIQELANQIVSKQRSQKKLPTWFQTKEIYYPPKLNLEQTSSEITANYKSEIVSGNTLIDITGGFGVDSYAFSKKFKKVIHCEMNEELSRISNYNFKKLNIENIKTIHHDGIEYLNKNDDAFDCIYIDPSRRDDEKRKVVLLKDCTPNVPENLNVLFQKSKTVLIKVSPILDITSTINELAFVKEVHIVSVYNEVKELLFLLENSFQGDIHIKTINFAKTKKEEFQFIYNSEIISEYDEPQIYLYEPNSAILKSGGFHQITSKFDVKKLHQHSHLYTSKKLIDFPGRSFKIVQTSSYDRKKIKRILSSQKANITTRNFPKTVQEIRKELKLKDGGSSYLFFTTNSNNKHICISCEKV